jgi:hypothetical protein
MTLKQGYKNFSCQSAKVRNMGDIEVINELMSLVFSFFFFFIIFLSFVIATDILVKRERTYMEHRTLQLSRSYWFYFRNGL